MTVIVPVPPTSKAFAGHSELTWMLPFDVMIPDPPTCNALQSVGCSVSIAKGKSRPC